MKTENPGKRSITLRWGKPKLHGDDVRRYKVTFDFFYKESYVLFIMEGHLAYPAGL